MMKSILMVHQGSELYGSDRSFASSVESLSDSFEINIIIPEKGKIVNLLKPFSKFISYRPKGFLRKTSLKKSFFNAIMGIFSEVKYFFFEFKKFDIIYINTVVCFSAIIACIFTIKKEKYIHIREFPSGFSMLVFKLLLFFSRAKLIYNSNATSKAFSLDGKVIWNGVPAVKINKESQGYIGRRNVQFLIIGRINSWKGHKFFLDSISNFKDNISVRIVGDVFGDQHFFLNELKSIANQKQLNIVFYGFKDDPSEHYNWADYVIVPSTLPEPFGRVAIEAMSCATPVIAADHGGLSEIVSHNKDGMLFAPNNRADLLKCLEKAISASSDQYEKMSVNAYNKYNNYFSENIYKNNFLSYIMVKKDSK